MKYVFVRSSRGIVFHGLLYEICTIFVEISSIPFSIQSININFGGPQKVEFFLKKKTVFKQNRLPKRVNGRTDRWGKNSPVIQQEIIQ